MHKLQQTIKWIVYSLLIVNFAFYIVEDWTGAMHVLNDGSTLLEWASEFATSIDETAWFLLLIMFELETYVLSDDATSGWTGRSIRAIRLVCFTMLAHTIYAYVFEVRDLQATIPVDGVSDVCELKDWEISYVFNLEYTQITEENCAGLSSASEFFWTTESAVVTDAEGLELERDLAWADLVEASIWLLIILIIEIVVRLQNRGVTGGPLIRTANALQLLLYAALLIIGVYWASLSHWLYFWDELVWIAGFAAIEMNLSEWRDEMLQENLQSSPG